MSCTKTLSWGSAGRSGHVSAIGSKSVLSSMPRAPRVAARLSASVRLNNIPSTPTVLPCVRLCVSHVGMSGVSGRPSFISRISVPSSCCAACMKYRESVHSNALSAVTTMVAALPVKPLMRRKKAQWAPIYSLWWGSVLLIMAALTPALAISPRRTVSR